MIDNLDKAIVALQDGGLVAARAGGSIPGIVGGTSASADLGIVVYREGFGIYLENGGWLVGLPLDGQLIDESWTPNLELAVERVLNAYRGKIQA